MDTLKLYIYLSSVFTFTVVTMLCLQPLSTVKLTFCKAIAIFSTFPHDSQRYKFECVLRKLKMQTFYSVPTKVKYCSLQTLLSSTVVI